MSDKIKKSDKWGNVHHCKSSPALITVFKTLVRCGLSLRLIVRQDFRLLFHPSQNYKKK